MFSVSRKGRHIFGYSVYTGPVPVARTGLSGRRVKYLGQTANRLLPLRTHAVVQRTGLLMVADAQGRVPDPATIRRTLQAGARIWDERREVIEAVLAMSDEELAVLGAVANGPTPEERSDLSLADSFFMVPTQLRERKGSFEELRDRACGESQGEGRELFPMQGEREFAWGSLAGNAFFCPQPVPFPYKVTAVIRSPAEYFRLDRGAKWGDLRLVAANALMVMKVLENYPLPRPISAMPGVWYAHVRDKMNEFIRQGVPLNEPLIRMWVTLATIDSYDAVSAEIVHRLRRRERRQRRMGIIRAVALGVTLAILTAGIGLALAPLLPAGAVITGAEVATAVTTALELGLSVQERKEAAEGLEKIAKQFEQDDAGFAAEARQTAQALDYLAQQSEQAAQLSKEEAEAIAEGQVEREYGPEEVGVHDFDPLNPPPAPVSVGDLLMGGGIAAGAIGLLALLR